MSRLTNIQNFYESLVEAAQRWNLTCKKDKELDGTFYDMTRGKFLTKLLNSPQVAKRDERETWNLQGRSKPPLSWTMGGEMGLKRCFSAVVFRFSFTQCYLWAVWSIYRRLALFFFSLERYLQIDVDDIFIAKTGIRMKKKDVLVSENTLFPKWSIKPPRRGCWGGGGGGGAYLILDSKRWGLISYRNFPTFHQTKTKQVLKRYHILKYLYVLT